MALLRSSVQIRYAPWFVIALFLALAVFFFVSPQSETTKEYQVHVPMRDGSRLVTDLYSQNFSKALPGLLLRTPYPREYFRVLAENFARQGYVVAIQSLRGAEGSQGNLNPFLTDGWGEEQDGFDAVEFLAAAPYCKGEVGTFGRSAMGISQLLLAPTAPPSLVCQYIEVAASNLYEHMAYQGGCLRKNQVESWIQSTGIPNDYLSLILSQKDYGPFWEKLNTLDHAEKVNVPAVHVGGWYDIVSQGTIDAFLSRQYGGAPGARLQQKLIMGPWVHDGKEQSVFGDFSLPQAAHEIPSALSMESYFAKELKGESLPDAPAVHYFVMGPLDQEEKGNFWRSAAHWPVPTVEKELYLTKSALTSSVAKEDASLYMEINPDQPTPSLGGRRLFLRPGPVDQSPLTQHKETLLFETELLEEDLEVTGRLFAEIFASSDQDQGQLSLRLCDVYPNGQKILVAEGIQTFSSTGEAKAVSIDLWSTSQIFAKGHRILVILSASHSPCFSLEVGKSTQKIYMGPSFPSKVILPIYRGEASQEEQYKRAKKAFKALKASS